jgi:lysine 2-monooxygenase
MPAQRKKHYEVAIVGAGITGLFAAWRLVRQDPAMASRIVLLDAAQRIGGRLKTSEVEHQGKRVLVEEGGMRFLEDHRLLQRLLRELGLEKKIVSFGMGDEQNLYYLRGRRFTRGDAKRDGNRIWGEIYGLSESERGKSPFTIVEGVMKRILRGAQVDQVHPRTDDWKPENPQSWARFRQMEYPPKSGLRIYQWGFRALLHHEGISNECIQMLMDTGGFTIPYEDMVGAGTGLQLIASFPDNPNFFTLQEGYEELPRRVAAELAKLGVDGEKQFRVRAIKKAKGGKSFTLDSEDGRSVLAHKVITAIPAVPLRALLPKVDDARMDARILSDVAKIVHMPLTKINLFFDDEWWQSLKITHGGCFTDVPLAQVYFFKINGLEEKRRFTVVTIYSDGRRATYWRQLQQLGPDFSSDAAAFKIMSQGDSVICKTLVVDHCIAQLQSMFDVELRAPVFATISMWGADERLGEGDHQWAVGADDIAIRQRLAAASENFYICGEAVSDYQDWVEGALRSADRILQEGFALPPYLNAPSTPREPNA